MLYAFIPTVLLVAAAVVGVAPVRSRTATKRLPIEQGLYGDGHVAALHACVFASQRTAPRALVALAALMLSASVQAQPVDRERTSEQWYSRASDGHRTYVYELGRARAAGDTVVVLHGGWGADHSYLVDGMRALGDAYRLVFYDQRGSLRSPAPDSTITLARLVEDLDDLRADAGLERMTLVAHSMGNHLAYAYLAAHPERVRGLVLVGAVLPTAFSSDGPGAGFLAEAAPEADTAAVRAAYAEALPALLVRGVRRQATEGLLPARFADATAAQVLSGEIDRDPDVRAAFAAMGGRDRTRAWRISFAAVNTCDGANWRDMQGGQVFYNGGVARAVMSQPTFDADVAAMWPALRAFAGPVRVVHGTCDYTDPGPVVWPHVVTRLRDGRLTVVDGAGHSLWMDRPAAFADALRAALADATP